MIFIDKIYVFYINFNTIYFYMMKYLDIKEKLFKKVDYAKNYMIKNNIIYIK